MTDSKSQCPASSLFLGCLKLPLTRSHFVELLLCLRPQWENLACARPGHRWVLDWTWRGQASSKLPKEGSRLSSNLQTLYSLGQVSLFCCTRPQSLMGYGLKWAIWLLRCVIKKANITNDNVSLNKAKQQNPVFIVALKLCLFGLSRYPLMSLKMNHFISNCYMPVWFLCFCFSAFHRCHITQSCALVRLRRFLPPCPAQPPCLRFSCSSCLHTLLIAIHSTCPANWANWSERGFSAGDLAVLQDFAALSCHLILFC